MSRRDLVADGQPQPGIVGNDELTDLEPGAAGEQVREPIDVLAHPAVDHAGRQVCPDLRQPDRVDRDVPQFRGERDLAGRGEAAKPQGVDSHCRDAAAIEQSDEVVGPVV